MRLIRLTWGVALSTTVWVSTGTAGERIGVVDLTRLIKAHPDAPAAEQTMKKYRDELEAEHRQLVEDGQALKEEYDKAHEASQNKALSESARDKKRKEAEEKLASLRDFEQKAREQLLRRQREVADQNRRLYDAMMGKLEKVIQEYAETHGYGLILNARSPAGAAPLVVYYSDRFDLTAEILKRIRPEGSHEKP